MRPTGKLPICKRLLCCAQLVPQGARVADIGCDHGYLGIHLLQQGQATFVHACDLREQPLKKAMANALRYGTAEKMQFSQADGLTAVAPETVDTIVCAGMGGDLIAQVLAAAPWLKNERYLLLLQPQSGGQDLRQWLCAQGFGIEAETLVEDGGFIYNLLSVRYGRAQTLTPGQTYCSPQLLESGSPLLCRYLERIEAALRLTVQGIERATAPSAQEKQAYYQAAWEEISQFLHKKMSR